MAAHLSPRALAFCDLASLGWAPVAASIMSGYSADRSNASKRSRRKSHVIRIQQIRSFPPDRLRWGFAAVALSTGSLSAAYRAIDDNPDLSSTAVRARASRLFRQLETQVCIYRLAQTLARQAVHPKARYLVNTSKAAESRLAAAAAAKARERRLTLLYGYSGDQEGAGNRSGRSPANTALRRQQPEAALERKRCGARTRAGNGAPCRCKVVQGRNRCRLHGGLSTGPRTAAGKARCAEGIRKHFEGKRDAVTCGRRLD